MCREKGKGRYSLKSFKPFQFINCFHTHKLTCPQKTLWSRYYFLLFFFLQMSTQASEKLMTLVNGRASTWHLHWIFFACIPLPFISSLIKYFFSTCVGRALCWELNTGQRTSLSVTGEQSRGDVQAEKGRKKWWMLFRQSGRAGSIPGRPNFYLSSIPMDLTSRI